MDPNYPPTKPDYVPLVCRAALVADVRAFYCVSCGQHRQPDEFPLVFTPTPATAPRAGRSERGRVCLNCEGSASARRRVAARTGD